MLKRHSQFFEALFTISDLAVVSVAWTLSYWLRFASEVIPISKGVPPFTDYLRMLVFVWLIWAFVFRRFGLYKPMRGINRWRETWVVLKANSLSVLMMMSMTYLFWEKSVPFSRLVFAIFWVLSALLTVSSRSLIRGVLRSMRRRGYNLRYALLVGAGESAIEVARSLVLHPEYGIELVGCLVKDRHDTDGLSRAGDYITSGGRRLRFSLTRNSLAADRDYFYDLPIIGDYGDLPRFLREETLDQVIVALPYAEHAYLDQVIDSIGDTMIDVKIVPDVRQFIQLGSEIEEINGVPVVSLASTPLSGVNRVFKRAVDLVFGVILFILSLPLMFLLALAVKLTSRGPVLFKQERVGLDGRRFNIYKFRTMSVNAEVNGAQFAVRNDPRTTLLGSFLRRFSLDELPQLVNVILGHMSLVGPRPERPVFIDEFRQHIPRYMLRHKVQAGMTGWAQVHGWRGNTSIEKRIEYDLYYIEHWSLALDLKILGLTLINGIRNRNAY